MLAMNVDGEQSYVFFCLFETCLKVAEKRADWVQRWAQCNSKVTQKQLKKNLAGKLCPRTQFTKMI
jgi:hypothetical protein